LTKYGLRLYYQASFFLFFCVKQGIFRKNDSEK